VSADLVVAAALELVGETHEGAGRSTALRVRGEEDGSSAARAQSGSVADPEGPTDPKGPATGPKGPAADPSGPGREPGSERRGERSGARAEARTSIRTKASASERTGTQAVEKKAEGTAKP
jgi:hypothetical protein